MEDSLKFIYQIASFVLGENFDSNHILLMNVPIVVISIIVFFIGFHKAYISSQSKHLIGKTPNRDTKTPPFEKKPSKGTITSFIPTMVISLIFGLLNTFFAIFWCTVMLSSGIDLIERSKGEVSVWDQDTTTIPFRKARRLAKVGLIAYAIISGTFRLSMVLDYFASRAFPFIGGQNLAILQGMMPFLGSAISVFLVIFALVYYSRWVKPAWNLPLDQIRKNYGSGVMKRFYQKHFLSLLLILSGLTVILILGYFMRDFAFSLSMEFINGYLHAFEWLMGLNILVMAFSIFNFFLYRSKLEKRPFFPFLRYLDRILADLRAGKPPRGKKQSMKFEYLVLPLLLALGFTIPIVAVLIGTYWMGKAIASYSRPRGSWSFRLACIGVQFLHVALLIGITYVYFLALGIIMLPVSLAGVLLCLIDIARGSGTSKRSKYKTGSKKISVKSKGKAKKVAAILLVSYLTVFTTYNIHGILVQPRPSEIRLSILDITLSGVALDRLGLDNVSVDVRVGEVIFEDITIMDAYIYNLIGSTLDLQSTRLEDIYISGIHATEYSINNINMGSLNLNALPFPGITFEDLLAQGVNCAYGDVQSVYSDYIILHDVFLDAISVDFTQLEGVMLEDVQLGGAGIANLLVDGMDLQELLVNNIDLSNQGTMAVTLQGISLSHLSLDALDLDKLELEGTSLGELSLESALLDYIAFNQIAASDLIAINPELNGLYLEALAADSLLLKNQTAELALHDALLDSATLGSVTAANLTVDDAAFDFLDTTNASVGRVIIRDIQEASIGVLEGSVVDALFNNVSITVTVKIEA